MRLCIGASLTTYALPANGSYATFMKDIATLVADNLR
jgi:hypothetical protein